MPLSRAYYATLLSTYRDSHAYFDTPPHASYAATHGATRFRHYCRYLRRYQPPCLRRYVMSLYIYAIATPLDAATLADTPRRYAIDIAAMPAWW